MGSMSIPNYQFPTSNSQLPIPNFQFPTPNSQLPIPNFQFPTSNSQLPIPNFQVQNVIGNWELGVGNWELSLFHLQVTTRERRNALALQVIDQLRTILQCRLLVPVLVVHHHDRRA